MLIRIIYFAVCLYFTSGAWASDYFIQPGRQFTPDGIITSGDSLETGEINGINYRFWLTDGSGRVGNWDVKCERDKFNDNRTCTMWYSYDDLTISLNQLGRVEILVGIEHFPGTPVLLRIDNAMPLKTPEPGWSGKAAIAIVSKLRNAQKISTRYQRWPYKDNIDTEIQLAGFAEAFDYMKFAVSKARNK